MKKLKIIRDIFTVIWGISLVARIISKTTNLFEIPKGVGYIIFISVLISIGLSIFIYIKEKQHTI